MLNVRLAGDHLYGKLLFTWLSLVMSMMVSFYAVLFPTRCLGWDIELNWVSFWGFSFLLFYTCINYTVFFRFLSSELTYDNYCTCHSFINCIYQYILLLSIFFSVTSRAIVIFYFRFRSSNNCYYFFLCNVVCYIVYSYILFQVLSCFSNKLL